MHKDDRAALAIIAAAIAVPVLAWLDGSLMADARRGAAATFDASGLMVLGAIAAFMIGGAVLLLGTLAWRTASVAVGSIYLAVGAVLALAPVVSWTLGSVRAGMAEAVLPEDLAVLVNTLAFAIDGPLNAVSIVAGGMVVAGLATIVRGMRTRRSAGDRRAALAAGASADRASA